MKRIIINVFAIIFIYFLFLQTTEARPNSRVKRVSDQRLAEINTQIGLSKMRGQLVTIPIAHGEYDPKIMGRKRRSQANLLELLLSKNEEDNFQEQSHQEPLLSYDDIYKR